MLSVYASPTLLGPGGGDFSFMGILGILGILGVLGVLGGAADRQDPLGCCTTWTLRTAARALGHGQPARRRRARLLRASRMAPEWTTRGGASPTRSALPCPALPCPALQAARDRREDGRWNLVPGRRSPRIRLGSSWADGLGALVPSAVGRPAWFSSTQSGVAFPSGAFYGHF